MSELSDIESALNEAKRVCDSLDTWQRGADGRDSVKSSRWAIERGIQALERHRSSIANRPIYSEPPEDFRRTACYCSEPTCAPPCGWCTDPENNEEDEESK